MKKAIYFILMNISVWCTAQIYPLNTSASDVPHNAYIKDINNELNKYEGVWKGEWNGKTLYLELKKVKYHSNTGTKHFYKDEIFGERKVVNANGVAEIDRITNFDNEDPEFIGLGVSLENYYWKTILFFPRNMCGKGVRLTIVNFNETNHTMTLRFKYMPSYKLDESCEHYDYVQQHDDFPINFPREDIVLTKQ